MMNEELDLDDDNTEIPLEPGSQLYRIVALCLGTAPGTTMRWGTLQALVEGRTFRVEVDTIGGPNGPTSEVVAILGLLP